MYIDVASARARKNEFANASTAIDVGVVSRPGFKFVVITMINIYFFFLFFFRIFASLPTWRDIARGGPHVQRVSGVIIIVPDPTRPDRDPRRYAPRTVVPPAHVIPGTGVCDTIDNNYYLAQITVIVDAVVCYVRENRVSPADGPS